MIEINLLKNIDHVILNHNFFNDYTCCLYMLLLFSVYTLILGKWLLHYIRSLTLILTHVFSFKCPMGFAFRLFWWIIRWIEIEITDIPRVGYLPSQIILIYYFMDRVGSSLTCESYASVYSRSSIDFLSTNFVFVLCDRDKTTHRKNRYIYWGH